ncbi:MAG: metal ABC transporter permease [Alphaproteobacteria bacterium]|nr:metal ABC transporter permease [Alphaproteobacteria bacterium]
MIDVIREMLSYPFLVRAIMVGLLVALCASLLGVSLVLKRFSMIGDGLSHVGFGALAIASVANIAPLYLAIPVCIAASFLLLRMSESTRIKGDAAIAMLSAGALAIGVMVVSMTTGMNTDVYNYMFGSILSLSASDATLSIVLSGVVLVLFVLFYPRLFAVTFDESFSRATGIPTRAYNAALATLASVTVVLGMRMMGALLISSLIIFPVLTAMRIGKRYLSVTLLSAAVAVVGFLVGMLVSYVFEAPSGASIVCVNIVLFVLFAIAGAIKNAVTKK